MRPHTGVQRHRHRVLRPPRLEVEASVSQLVSPKLIEWLDALGKASARVLVEADAEAVHDLRVTLRRIRSLLRIVRPVYGRFHVDVVRSQFAGVADATGSLRDEEVLGETLDALELGAPERAGLAPWRHKRKHRMRALRTSVVRLITAGNLVPPTETLQALLKLPCDPKSDKEVRRFARQIVIDAQGDVDRCRAVETSDVAGMHALRIAHKRLRYAIEAFEQVLPPELRAWRDVSSKFQSMLGHLHDHDVALEVFRKVTSLPAQSQHAVLDALMVRREELAAQYVEASGHPSMPPEA